MRRRIESFVSYRDTLWAAVKEVMNPLLSQRLIRWPPGVSLGPHSGSLPKAEHIFVNWLLISCLKRGLHPSSYITMVF